ncbi:hypothetical protein BC941DRAFT_434317 [Chlamydoabsidia padenii]|nr:hypothetical protein BC941DRAFT_434317 [Chlamydoabsidia padenii]
MTHRSSKANSPPKTAFQWPAPLSPRLLSDGQDTTAINTDTPLKEILEKYQDDADILRHILLAKAEEDKRLAARDMLKTEQARIYLKQLDLEYIREQNRLYQIPPPPATSLPLPPPPPPPQSATSSIVAAAGTPTVYGLAPVQQQVLARLTGTHSDHQQQPSSPVAYPHSAHPLCPDVRTTSRYQRHRPTNQPSTPISPETRQKRTQPDDKLSHNKVMEALKAKIQRGSPHTEKRQRHLPTRSILQDTPRSSAKQALPPIDTNVGRPSSSSPTPTVDRVSPSDQLLPPSTRQDQRGSSRSTSPYDSLHSTSNIKLEAD